MDEYLPDNLQDLGQIAMRTTMLAGEVFPLSNEVSQPGRSLILKNLTFEIKDARDAQRRRDLRK